MLKLPSPEPQWFDCDLPAGRIRVLMRPIVRGVYRAAQHQAFLALQAGQEDQIALGQEISAALMRAAIVDWDGVGDADGNPLPVGPESIEQFLNHPDAFAALERAYCQPWYDRDREKNASSGSPSGTGTAAMPGNDTASSPAPVTAPGDAMPAPTAKKHRTAPPATTSGT